GTREATSMNAVPRRLVVLGGGPAGVEIAQIVRRLGGGAVLVEGADRPAPPQAAPPGGGAGEAHPPGGRGLTSGAQRPAARGGGMRRDGIELMLGTQATAARREAGDFVLELEGGAEARGDRLLVATGRRPRVEGIGLETVGVKAGPGGITVDEYLVAGERT